MSVIDNAAQLQELKALMAHHYFLLNGCGGASMRSWRLGVSVGLKIGKYDG